MTTEQFFVLQRRCKEKTEDGGKSGVGGGAGSQIQMEN